MNTWRCDRLIRNEHEIKKMLALLIGEFKLNCTVSLDNAYRLKYSYLSYNARWTFTRSDGASLVS